MRSAWCSLLRSYGSTVLVADPPASSPSSGRSAPASPVSPPSGSGSKSANGRSGQTTSSSTNGKAKSPSSSFDVVSRDYAREMASISVELDGTIEEDEDSLLNAAQVGGRHVC